ncbi:MAG: site-2 protease family protein [Imperialibacter sp.]|uniref:site-2 protease family protein n=1 Tax=Imperialibacter sp. TaxID=2038411 RepID=UPI0032EFEE22
MEEIEGSSPERSLQEQIKELEIAEKKKEQKRLFIHIGLFIATFICTTLAGAEWSRNKFLLFSEGYTWADFVAGMEFSIPFLTILTFHEFGHYLTAKYYKIKVTLPYYLPLWLGFLGSPSIGTMGAFINIKGKIKTRQQYFDIGIAGPLAGFVVALFVLWYGFTHLPPQEDIFQIHPEYAQYGLDYPNHVYSDSTASIGLGNTILFDFFKEHVTTQPELLPHPNEIIHYPWILAGYLALFFTALNLLPIGQLDGGHIVYGLLGLKNSRLVSAGLYIAFIFYAGLGIVTPFMDWTATTTFFMMPVPNLFAIPVYIYFLKWIMQSLTENDLNRWMVAVGIFTAQFVVSLIFPMAEGYSGWLLYGIILGRFIGIYHPPVAHDQPLDFNRKVLGWIALIIFVICWSPNPFTT